MIRLSTLIWMMAVVVGAFLLYMVKYQVQGLNTQVAQAERELAQEREALHVAAAEWAYLNRPERLRELAARHLSASAVTVSRIAEIEAIPFPAKTEASAPSRDIHPVSARRPGSDRQ